MTAYHHHHHQHHQVYYLLAVSSFPFHPSSKALLNSPIVLEIIRQLRQMQLLGEQRVIN